MEWLNTNAGALQAVGTAVVVLVTIILVRITGRYVKLTGRLATAAERQIEFLSQEAENKRRELLTLIKMLKLQLGTLPTDHAAGEQMRKAVLWENADLTQLQSLAARFSLSSGEQAAKAGTAMRRLAEQVESVKALDPRSGVRWSQFDWSGWDAAWATAHAELDELAKSTADSRGELDVPA